MSPTRPLVRYHGGKWELAPWIITHLPPHRTYCEPFAGAASVLLRKPRSYCEVLNDLDGEMVNLFRVVRDQPANLLAAVLATPFSRWDYLEAFNPSEYPVEAARRVLIRSHMGHAGAATHGRCTGFRSKSVRSGSHPASQWRNFPHTIQAIFERLRGVVLENRPAHEVIEQQDDASTLFYVDPPYVFATRDGGKDYRHELSDDEHRGLAAQLRACGGMVVLSGYPSELYDELYEGWAKVEREGQCEGGGVRTECLWFNAAAVPAQPRQMEFFAEAT